MKKLSLYIFLVLMLSNLTFADSKFKYKPVFKNNFIFFNKWLYDNGHHQYLNLDEGPTSGICKTEPKFSQVWFQNSCDKFVGTNNLKIKPYKGRWSIPFKKSPNRDTLVYYLYKYLYSHETGDHGSKQWSKYEIQPSKSPYEFKSELKENKFIKKSLIFSIIILLNQTYHW